MPELLGAVCLVEQPGPETVHLTKFWPVPPRSTQPSRPLQLLRLPIVVVTWAPAATGLGLREVILKGPLQTAAGVGVGLERGVGEGLTLGVGVGVSEA